MTTDASQDLTEGAALRELLARVPLPDWAPVRLTHDAERIDNIAAAVAAELGRPEIGGQIRPGMRVALTAGSRGIDRIDEVLASAVRGLKELGAEPFIVPAMGSHGGAVVDGQLAVLAHYGVTEERMGCSIRASMDVVELGQLDSGEQVYTDRIAYTEADRIVPVGRVKVHTDFQGQIESGLFKMLAIGLGKQAGAESLHRSGFENFPWLIPAAGRFLIQRLPVPFGIAVVDNGYGALAHLEAIPAAQIEAREPELLADARRRLARLPVERIDVLVVDQMGKDISGAGMDPNVLGRYYGTPLPGGPAIQRVVVLDLTVNSEGNATGIGMADMCAERLARKVDRAKTYMNQLTAKTPEGGRMPMVAPNDRVALQMAISSLRRADLAALRVVRIHSTKDLTDIWASAALLPDLEATGRATILSAPAPPAFDTDGNLW